MVFVDQIRVVVGIRLKSHKEYLFTLTVPKVDKFILARFRGINGLVLDIDGLGINVQ